MNSQKLKPLYGGTALLLALLAGVGAVVSYPYWGLRSDRKLTASSSVNHYRTDWLGI